MRLTSQKGFSGIDERADFGNDLGAATVIKNFRITDSGSITRRQGVNRIFTSGFGDITGIWSGNIAGKEMVVYSSGGYLFYAEPNKTETIVRLIGSIGTGDCVMFEFGGILYIKNADYYGKYDGTALTAVEGYIPLVAMSCTPQGEGEIFEQINLLTDKRRQLFSSNGSSLMYYLAEKAVDSVISITVDGEEYGDKWAYNSTEGYISFATAPTEGLNNVEIVYSKAHSEDDLKRIMGCTRVMRFGGNSDGRIFLWGNPDYPNYRFHSELADGIPSAEYFPINAFTIIGNSKINCIVQQYDKQLIFTDSEAYYSYAELRDDGMGNTYTSFPVYSLNDGKGCIIETDGCVMDNMPVTLCHDGLNRWESTSVENEKNAVCFSMPIYKSMESIISGDKDSIHLFDFQANRELYFIYGDTAYIYNYGNGAWYTYDNFEGEHYSVYGRLLYFSGGSNLYLFGNEIETDLEGTCVWQSPFITGGGNGGRSDLIGFEADMHIKGASNCRFDFEKSGDRYLSAREFVFPEDTDRYLRIGIRPGIKRAMPFRIKFTDMGPGRSTIHGIIIKTREKERSSRDGVL